MPHSRILEIKSKRNIAGGDVRISDLLSYDKYRRVSAAYLSCKSLRLIFGAEVTYSHLEVGIDVAEVYPYMGEFPYKLVGYGLGAYSCVLAVVKIDSDAIAGNLALGVSIDVVQECIAKSAGLSYDSRTSTGRGFVKQSKYLFACK